MTFLFSFKMFKSLGGAKSYFCSMLNIIINRRTIYTYLNVRFSMNPSIVISSSRTKSMIPGSSRVAMVILLSSRVVTKLRRVGWVGLLIPMYDILIADFTCTYLFRVGNVSIAGSGETTARIDTMVVGTRTVEQSYCLELTTTAHCTDYSLQAQ